MTRRISRRQFLRCSVRTAATGVALPAIVRSGALATSNAPSASDRIRLAYIGVGIRGDSLLGRYIKNPRFPVVAICDVDAHRRAKATDRVGPPCAQHNDYRRVLDQKDVDAVVISVPDHWHAPIAVHACEAGMDVYCETPLSLTIGQGKKMVEASRRHGRVFQTGSQQRSANEFRQACELVRSGRLGRVKRVLVDVWGTSRPCSLPAEPTPPGLDWNLWLGPAPRRPFHPKLHPTGWREFRDYSGGVMTDQGAHHLDIIQWALNLDASGPVEALPPTTDRQWVTLKYPRGIRVLCGNTGIGGIRFEGNEGRITVKRGLLQTEPEELGREPLRGDEVRLERSPDHQADWEEAMWKRARPIADVEIGHRSATVCHLANIVTWLNRSIRWDPVSETIIGDPEAGRWLDRPLRTPFAI